MRTYGDRDETSRKKGQVMGDVPCPKHYIPPSADVAVCRSYSVIRVIMIDLS